MKIRIDSMTLYPYSIKLATPFRISVGEIQNKGAVILELHSGDFVGWGEAAVDDVPFYAHETVGSVIDIFRNTLAPLLLGKEFSHPDEVSDYMDHYRGNHFAKAAVDAAVWDIYGKMQNQPVWKLLGGTHREFEVGPSIGIKNDPDKTLAAVEKHLADDPDIRIKIKVCPGFDTPYIEKIRNAHPDIRLMVDANNAYDISAAQHIADWDRFKLLMIEQPLDERDIYFHSVLRRQVKNPICLDESIHTMHDVRCCAALGSADIINIKVCRVGGLTNARRIHDFCQQHGIANWIGGRVGFNVSDAPRVAAATLPNCTLPSDCIIDAMYMPDDILENPFRTRGGKALAPMEPGLGFEINREKLVKYATATIQL